MKTVYLHIGCGKTGSSALQVWFSQTADKLKAMGVAYPQERPVKSEYEITSGNGELLINRLRHGDVNTYLDKVFTESSNENILFSSESFQGLTPAEIEMLNSIFLTKGIKPLIIAYIRNIYEFSWSAYGQMIKRHGYYGTFEEFVSDQSWRHLLCQHLNVIDKFARYYDDVRVLHYDTVKSHLDASFLNAIGLDSNAIPPMGKRTVNRSLTPFELELMRLLNQAYQKKFGTEGISLFSMRISDALVYADPERKGGFYYDDKLAAQLETLFAERVAAFNERFFSGEKVLKIVDDKQKREDVAQIEIDGAFTTTLNKLFEMTDSLNLGH